MHWDLRVVTAPSNDTDLAILVTFDHAKYLFNCGEGTQRSFVQKRLSMKKLSGVFFTSGNVEVVAGLPGLIMSAADAGVRKLDIGGPRNIAQHLVSCRTFLQRDNMKVNILNTPEDAETPIFAEPHVTITAVKLTKARPMNTRIADPTPSSAGGEVSDTNGQGAEMQGSESESEGRVVSAAAAPDADLMNRDIRLKTMSAKQLDEWRKLVIGDILGGPKTAPANPSIEPIAIDGANTHSNADLAAGSAKRHPRANVRGGPGPSRLRMSEVLPLRGYEEKAAQQDPRDDRVAYILQAPMVRGKFDASKAKALQVPNGPLRGKLTAGEAIEFEVKGSEGVMEKRVVKPEDVLGPSQEGGACIIVDAEAAYMQDLLASTTLREYRITEGQSSPRRVAHTVVHRIPGSLATSPEYQEWMRSFGPATHHLLADYKGYTDAVTFASSAWNLVKMSMLDEKIFPPVVVGNPRELPKEEVTCGASVTTAKSDLEIRLMPPGPFKLRPSVKEETEYPRDQESIEAAKVKLAADMPAYADLIQQARHKEDIRTDRTEAEHYGIQVTPLGTGSAIPSKYRNVSSTLLEIPDFGNVLLDAGEGTLGQLRRRFGLTGMAAVYARLRVIFISHMHADHHMGLRALLLDRHKVNHNETLYIIAPSYILLYLGDNSVEISDRAGNVRFIDSFHSSSLDRRHSDDVALQRPSWSKPDGMIFRHASARSRDRSLDTLAALERDGDMRLVRTVDVNHRGRAWGLILEHNKGWKIAYSGDTMPCQALVDAGRDATLLIHEATLEDDKPDVAAAKGHSTFGQAIDIGMQMKAKYILLNHFSQRYPKLPVLQERDPTEDSVGTRVAMAFDLMTLPLSSFHAASTYTPALENLFAEYEGAESDGGEQDQDEPPAKAPKKGQPGDKASAKAIRAEQARVEQAMNGGAGCMETDQTGRKRKQKQKQEQKQEQKHEQKQEFMAKSDSATASEGQADVSSGVDLTGGDRGQKRVADERSPRKGQDGRPETKRARQEALP